MFDIDEVRAATPGCENVIHFNNAGASLMPDPVYNAVTQHLRLERERGGYEAAHEATKALERFYSEFAALLGAAPQEIAFVENATRAWDMAFYGLPLKAGDRILTHASEYASNYMALLQQAKRRGLFIDVVPSDHYGQIDVQAMEALVKPTTRLIALTHIPTQGGLVNPAERVGAFAAEHGLIFLLDACQSAGQMELNVQKLGCHILTGTGRKFLRGPRGTGFLYVRGDMIDKVEPPFVDLHAAQWTDFNSFTLADGAKRYENWESFVAGRIGLATAVRYARSLGLGHIESRVQHLGAALRTSLRTIPGVSVHDLGQKQCGIVTFRKEGVVPSSVASTLAAKSINVSVSELKSARLDLANRGLDALVRASVHYFNTENEIDRFTEILKSVH